ncbi:sigma factor-like helix-turn-helix DNA-binding protein [Demequina rhizosphaerae]|uniref:sigma factor-like helix-turn-helix DNA-binding protein n=1 Tax=Demequina rhizosphaerae TaxID=1638985 RepID=UPI0007825969|nr:sigma factor-like helix-turn-helix DNA-binding protein [Demequina rhizosphaerae]
MDATLAGLSEGARTRLAADAYLLEGEPAAAERLLRSAALRVLTARRRGPLEAGIRGAMVELHLHRGRRRPAESPPASGTLEALRALTPRQRAATILRLVDGLSTTEVATSLGLREPAAGDAVRVGHLSLAGALGVAASGVPDDVVEEVEVSSRRDRSRGAP